MVSGWAAEPQPHLDVFQEDTKCSPLWVASSTAPRRRRCFRSTQVFRRYESRGVVRRVVMSVMSSPYGGAGRPFLDPLRLDISLR